MQAILGQKKWPLAEPPVHPALVGILACAGRPRYPSGTMPAPCTDENRPSLARRYVRIRLPVPSGKSAKPRMAEWVVFVYTRYTEILSEPSGRSALHPLA